MQYTSILLTGASLLASVSAHGFLTEPKPRLAGTAMQASCGMQVFYNQNSDTYGNIQGELQVGSSQNDFNPETCNLWLCKGFKFEDNTANVQSYTPGQVVPFKFDLRAPHAGVANISIVDTATNTIIGTPLLSYDDFGNNAYPTPADQLSFSITIPTTLGSKCAVAGACVIQHWWDARSINQSYESCIDFTVGGGSGAAPAPPAASSSAVAASSAAPVVTSAAPSSTAAVSAVPTTLQTLTRPASSSAAPVTTTSAVAIPASTTAAAPVVTSAPTTPVEQEEDCEEL